MTAPTQPPDPRVQRIADALDVWSDTVGYESHRRLARVLVEELGGREGSEPVETADPRIAGWMEVCIEIFKLFPTMHTDMRQIPVHSRQAAAIRQLAAQQRENAETIAALAERAQLAEDANKMLDDARKSAEQSARDLRAMRDKLRAELDAIKGAQVPYRWAVVDKEGMSFTFTSLEKAQAWAIGDRGGVVPLYTHPAPALPVVGACVIGVLTAKTDDATNCISFHMDTSKYIPSKIVPPDGEYDIWLGAPLPTEGGK